MSLFMHKDKPTPFHADIERLVNKGAIFTGLSEDEKQQAIHEIDKLLGREITIAIAVWADWWTTKTKEDQALAVMGITREALAAFEALGHS